ncbi:MAG: alcohol dehydrogenase catalytic domain-containing protein [Candidatus Korobacteraceae bacterium]|jgi:L-iditol 2-dehydrogenase
MKMKTGYLSDLSKVVVKEFEVPDFDEHSVLVKVKAAGICGSDLHAFHGSHPFRKPPMILGHEAVGEVVKLGAKVKELKVGDRIAVEPIKSCGSCSYCLSGNYNLCPEKVIAGVRGWLGTFAEYFVLPEQRAHKLPEELDYELGVLAEPLAVGTHAVRLANIKKGSTCAVLGTGTVGLLAGVAAQEAGAGRVYCTDLNRFRLQIAKTLGLYPIKADEVSVEETIKSFAPDGADVVLLAFTSPSVVDQALRLVKRGGTIIVIALFTDPIAVDLNTLQANEIDLKGTNVYIKEDFQRAIRILVKRKEDLRKAITHHVNLEGVNGALEMLADPNSVAIKVIVHP